MTGTLSLLVALVVSWMLHRKWEFVCPWASEQVQEEARYSYLDTEPDSEGALNMSEVPDVPGRLSGGAPGTRYSKHRNDSEAKELRQRQRSRAQTEREDWITVAASVGFAVS